MADDSPKKQFVFQHFKPIEEVSVKSIGPNFTGNVDVFDPKKNQAHFEELAVDVGLGAMKGAILKNTLKFFTPQEQVKKENLNFSKDQNNGMTILGHSVFGFPIYSNLTIKGDSYKDNAGNVIGKFSDIRIDAVIMEISRENNLVMTDIQGRNNTVIEYISAKSWKINVTGKILKNSPEQLRTYGNGEYPLDDVTNFISALDSNKSLQVTSWFLNMAGIYNMVIIDKNIPQEEGSQEYQKFEFKAIADSPVILKLKR